ncbi:hypothetical protein CR513_41020, partial [Mucuna pruriens]
MIENGNKLVLKEVRHILEMHLNLTLSRRLDETKMINQSNKLSQGSMIVACGKNEDSFYKKKYAKTRQILLKKQTNNGGIND